MPASTEKHFRELAILAARAADDKKGEDIALLHIRPINSLTDYLILINGTSPAHMEAIEENIRVKLKAMGAYAEHREGRRSELWRVLDYGGLLIHLMHPKAREFYALDKLFHDARKLAWRKVERRSH